jgi:hypothetical protein
VSPLSFSSRITRNNSCTIEYDQFRLAHQTTGDRQHLLLATRHGTGDLVAALGEPRKRLVHPLARLAGARTSAFEHRADIEVFLNRQRRKYLPPLGDLTDAKIADAVARQAGDVGTLETDASGTRLLDAGDRTDQARLAGPVGTDDRDQFAGVNGERHIVERLCVAVVEMQVLDGEDHSASSPR